GTSAPSAWRQRLRTRTRAPAAAARAAAVSSDTAPRTNSHTVRVVSRFHTRAGPETRRAAAPRRPPARRVRGAERPGAPGARALDRFHLAQSHAHDGGHAGLLHRDAVDRVRGLHGAGVVRDDDELRLILELDRKSTRLNSSHE